METILEKIDKIDDYLRDLVTPFMDLYTFARMFRSYKKQQGKYSESPSNIIAYVGDHHTKNYVRFFKYLNFMTVYSTRDPIIDFVGGWVRMFEHSNEGEDIKKRNAHCLKVTGLTLPLFDTIPQIDAQQERRMIQNKAMQKEERHSAELEPPKLSEEDLEEAEQEQQQSKQEFRRWKQKEQQYDRNDSRTVGKWNSSWKSNIRF